MQLLRNMQDSQSARTTILMFVENTNIQGNLETILDIEGR